jgi:uncharacterized protein YcbX
MELAEVVGQLGALRRFPVRGLGGEAPDEARVRGSGLAGDRVFDLYDEEPGAILEARTAPFLLRYRARFLDPWSAASTTGRLDEVSRRCGRSVRLRPRPEAETDPAPLRLISTPTLRFLEQQYGGPLEAIRLRSNVLLELPESRPFDEDRWIGRQIWIGDVLIEIVRPSDACVVTSLDAEARERSPGVLAAIARGRGDRLGVQARALTGNRPRVGDPVAIVD